jgi:all-trans-8'-apo-beta-carotenal 15,15'-oxygenase
MWGEKLLALWEAGSPYELDPATLATVGAATLDGWVRPGKTPTSTGSDAIDDMLGFGNAHTAHPHVLETLEGPRLVTWKWNSVMRIPDGTSLQIEFREYDNAWNVTSSR